MRDDAQPHTSFGWRELALIFVFWTSLATLTSVNRWLDPRGFGFRAVSPAGPIALVFVEAWIWAAFTPPIFWLSSRLSLDRSRWLVRIPFLLIVGIAISIAVYSLLGFARVEVFEVPMRRGFPAFSPMREIGRFRFANQLLVFLSILTAGYAREFFLRDRSSQHEAVALEARAAQLEAQLAGARLDALRMQLNPHFLFNTLHAVSALVERDPSGVRRMIARLSELLRHTTDAHAADEVPLREELAFLQRYIEIMEIRFQGRLRVERSIDAAALDGLVPNLILQPIVENALEHGASRSADGGVISVRAAVENGVLRLTVHDNGPGIDETPAASVGVGVANTRARLQQLYGGAASFALNTEPGGGTTATILIPFHATRAPEAGDFLDD